jgi:hypothetical protein
MRPNSTTEEIRSGTQFLRDYGLSTGTATFGDKPEIVANLGHRTIGVEITNAYRKSGDLDESEQKQRIWRRDIVAKAQAKCPSKVSRTMEPTFSFDSDNHICHQWRPELVGGLAMLCAGLGDHPKGDVSKAAFLHIPELWHVYWNATEYDDAKWRIVQCHSKPQMLGIHLAELVTTKELKVGGYKHCDAYWLLVVVDSFDRAQEQEFSAATVCEIRSNVFENIVVYDPHFARIVETNPLVFLGR